MRVPNLIRRIPKPRLQRKNQGICESVQGKASWPGYVSSSQTPSAQWGWDLCSLDTVGRAPSMGAPVPQMNTCVRLANHGEVAPRAPHHKHFFADSRVRGWFLLDSYLPTFTLTIVYLLSIWLGNKYMKNRPALSLRGILTLYNLGITLLSAYMLVEVSVCGPHSGLLNSASIWVWEPVRCTFQSGAISVLPPCQMREKVVLALRLCLSKVSEALASNLSWGLLLCSLAKLKLESWPGLKGLWKVTSFTFLPLYILWLEGLAELLCM